jgi:hypothetical protein
MKIIVLSLLLLSITVLLSLFLSSSFVSAIQQQNAKDLIACAQWLQNMYPLISSDFLYTVCYLSFESEGVYANKMTTQQALELTNKVGNVINGTNLKSKK